MERTDSLQVIRPRDQWILNEDGDLVGVRNQNGGADLRPVRYTTASDEAEVLNISASSTTAALTVTQTGSGNAFVVEDSASPDNSPFVIDAGGGVQLGHTVAIPSVAGSNSLNISNSGGRAQFTRWNTDTQGGRLYLAKANTTTIGSFASGTGVVSGDEMGGVYFEGANNSTGFVLGAGIAAHVDGTPNDTASDMPGRLTFSTSANGSATLVERMRIDSTGKVTGSASYVAHSATAIPAGGTAGAGLMVSSTANFGIFFGSGVPTLSAAQGSLYLRSDGSSTSTRMYVNTDSGTTWTAVTTAA